MVALLLVRRDIAGLDPGDDVGARYADQVSCLLCRENDIGMVGRSDRIAIKREAELLPTKQLS